MSSGLIEIVYSSLATPEPDEAALRALLDQSRRNNARLGVTGMLVYWRREYLQVLEGPAEDVQGLFARIRRDPRHDRIHLHWSGEIAERSFADWAMAFVAPGPEGWPERAGGSPFFEEGFAPRSATSGARSRSVGRAFLRALREQYLARG